MPSDKEIADLETSIQSKMSANRKERSTLSQALESITSIKMRGREEKIPAVPPVEGKPAIMDSNDPTVELTPAVPAQAGKPEGLKTVFDVMPKDPMIPSENMDQARRQKIFIACKSVIDSLNQV